MMRVIRISFSITLFFIPEKRSLVEIKKVFPGLSGECPWRPDMSHVRFLTQSPGAFVCDNCLWHKMILIIMLLSTQPERQGYG